MSGDYGYFFSNIIIRNNLVYNCGRSGIQVNAPASVKIYNNILYGNGLIDFAGLNLRWGGATSTYEVYNNTFYDNGVYTLDDDNRSGGGPFGQIYFSATCQSFTFVNNIVRSLTANEVYWTRSSTGGIQTFSNNLYYGNGGKPSFDNGASTLNVDPRLYNPTSDFHLQSGSPAKDSGYNTASIVTRDFDGLIRPQDAAVDMGAYEYAGAAVPDTTAPAAVSNLAAATGSNGGEINLTWTAPGDDGSSGTATTYIIKYSASAITTDAQFNAATDVTGEPAPAVAGTNQSMTVTGLTPGQTYYFAMKTQDEVPNTSALSN